MEIKVPEILNLPSKLLPFITKLGKYRFYLAEGGRGSGKSNAMARLIIYICEKRKVRVVCGRETQNTIEESVHRILADLIRKYKLNFDIQQNKIVHRKSGSEILFKGFKTQGLFNIKGYEGVDLLWIDEAEAISKETLDIIIPTIRKNNSMVWFSMNRNIRNDPVYEFCVGRDDCLHIHIDYFENPFCPEELIKEAEICKERDESGYRHIWLGEPKDVSSDYLFNSAKVERMKKIEPFGDFFHNQRVIGVDFAAQGNDFCVATVIDRMSNVHWKVVEQIAWKEENSMSSIGKIIDIITKYKPSATALDVGGMGYVVYNRLNELKIRINPFNGGEQKDVPNEYVNARAWGYYLLKEFIDNEWLIMDSDKTASELMEIRYKYRSNGERLIMSKDDMRRNGVKSPDRADSLMMAVFAIKNYLGTATGGYGVSSNVTIKRKTVSKF